MKMFTFVAHSSVGAKYQTGEGNVVIDLFYLFCSKWDPFDSGPLANNRADSPPPPAPARQACEINSSKLIFNLCSVANICLI